MAPYPLLDLAHRPDEVKETPTFKGAAFQSLLSWISPIGRIPGHPDYVLGGVSILVVVDLAHRHDAVPLIDP